MNTIKPSTRFAKDMKTITKRGYQIDLLTTVLKTLAAGKALAKKHNDHFLKGNYTGCREFHITPDWLLIYEIDEDDSILYLIRTGTHGDLF